MFRVGLYSLLVLMISACSNDNDASEKASSAGHVSAPQKLAASSSHQLTVYKSPTCGCCGDWVKHIQQNGFKADVVNQETVAHIKDRFGIPANARSCHTAVTDEGYLFEGHVPAKYIQAFLNDVPEGAKGLIVPAMPLGSPGMEYQNQFNPYQVLLMKTNGELEVYASVNEYQAQF